MKFHIGDLVTRPSDVHDHENRRIVRHKNEIEKRIGPKLLIGTIIRAYNDYVCMEGMEGQEHSHDEEMYDVVWRNWTDNGGNWDSGHIGKGFFNYGITLVESRMKSIAEINYVIRNLFSEMVKKYITDNDSPIKQVPMIKMQINTLRWALGKEPKYFAPLEKGGALDVTGQRLQEG